MRLDEDELYDYDDDSFNEEDAVADVLDALRPLNVSADEATQELEKLDWDVDAAIASLKRKNKPKGAPKSAPRTTNGKLSPLEALQQRRAAGAAAAGAGTEPAKARPSLVELAQKRKVQTGGSALDKLRQRPAAATVTPKQAAPDTRAASPPVKPQEWRPEISYKLPPAVQVASSPLGQLLVTPPHHSSETNFFPVPAQAKGAFAKPSPDDAVMTAQSGAFKAVPGFKPPVDKASTKNESAQILAARAATPPAPKPSIKPAAKIAARRADKSLLVQQLQSLQLKPSCSFVVIGHVDAGKSTLMGRLLLETGALTAKDASKHEHESSKAGKSSFWLAWALDATAEERARGVTVDISEAQFETEKAKFTILDAPGHKDYVPNMISGVAQADVAVLVVDSDTNAFESGFSLDGQTKEHAVLARSFGLDTVVVAVNKMDTQDWSEDRFEDIRSQLLEFLTRKVGFDASKIVFVPTSGIEGTNVYKTRREADSPTLVEALEKYALGRPRASVDAQPFRFVVSNAYVEPFQSTLTVLGRAVSGVAERGDTVELLGPGSLVEIKDINTEFSRAGQPSELQLQCADDVAKNSIKPGSILAAVGDTLAPTRTFEAKVRLFDIPRPILPGTKLGFHMGRVDTTVKVVRIIESLDKKAPKRLRHLGKGAAARVELELEEPAVVAKPDVCRALSRFVLRLNGSTVGGGVVD